jgi:hypothetical protein
MDKDGATFNRDSRRRRINLRPHESQILGVGGFARIQCPDQYKDRRKGKKETP